MQPRGTAVYRTQWICVHGGSNFSLSLSPCSLAGLFVAPVSSLPLIQWRRETGLRRFSVPFLLLSCTCTAFSFLDQRERERERGQVFLLWGARWFTPTHLHSPHHLHQVIWFTWLAVPYSGEARSETACQSEWIHKEPLSLGTLHSVQCAMCNVLVSVFFFFFFFLFFFLIKGSQKPEGEE